MRAIEFHRHDDPSKVLLLSDRPVPEPGPGMVRIQMLAAPINPSDLLFVRGHYSGVAPEFPSQVGFEGVGVVDALGPDVTGLAHGQRVAVSSQLGGTWAEYVVVPALTSIPVPDDLPDQQAASFIINPASAVLMVRHVLAVPKGEWLLQSAAGSELGRMVIRLAKHDGIRTINVVRRREAAAELEEMGADVVLVSSDGPIDDQVRAVVGAEGVRYAIDPVIGETGTQIYKSLHEDGRMLVYGSLTGEPLRLGDDPRDILSGRRIVEAYWLGYWAPRLEDAGWYPPGKPAIQQLVDELIALFRDGVLATSAGPTFSLDDIGAAVEQAETTARQGKVLLTPRET